jgi:hypothetical protein
MRGDGDGDGAAQEHQEPSLRTSAKCTAEGRGLRVAQLIVLVSRKRILMQQVRVQ